MDIVQILQHRYADKKWELTGDLTTFNGFIWLDPDPKPTEEHFESIWPEVSYEVSRNAVEQMRSNAYREISDPIFFQYQRGEASESDWIDAVNLVKESYPYPPPLQ